MMNIERIRVRRSENVIAIYENVDKMLSFLTERMDFYKLTEKHARFYGECKVASAHMVYVIKKVQALRGNDAENQDELRKLWRENVKWVECFRDESLIHAKQLIAHMNEFSTMKFEELWKRVEGFKTTPADDYFGESQLAKLIAFSDPDMDLIGSKMREILMENLE